MMEASDIIELQPASRGGVAYANALRQTDKGVKPLDLRRSVVDGRPDLEARSPANLPAVSEHTVVDALGFGDGKGGFEFIGEELKDGAPIWRVYRDEVTNHDKTVMLDEWNRILDVLLIFAGLFSAVVTAFTIVSYTLMQPDQNDRTATALYALALSLNSTAAKMVPLPAPSDSGSLTWVRGINILWFTSLILALTAALLSILAKQWLVEYSHRIAGRSKSSSDARSNMTSWKWASMRLFFNSGLTNWHTAGFVTEFLPLLLHLALFLFLIGLAMFIWTVDRVVAWVISGLTISVTTVYVVFTLMPLLSEECPTSTPLRKHIHKAVAFAISDPVFSLVQRCSSLRFFRRSRTENREASPFPTVVHPSRKRVHAWEAPENEHAAVDETLRWLITGSGSEIATKVAFQAIGGLSINSTLIPGLQVATSGLTALGSLGTLQSGNPSAVEVIRAIRSDLLLRRGSWALRRLGLDIPEAMFAALQHSYYPDARLLVAAMAETEQSTDHTVSGAPALQTTSYRDILKWRSMRSSSLPTTARMLIHCEGVLSIRQLLYLLVFVKRDLHRGDCEKIFSVLSHEFGARCTVSWCSPSCIVSLVGKSVQFIHRQDRALPTAAHLTRRSDIIASLAFIDTISYVVNSDVFDPTAKVHGFEQLLKFMSNDKWLPREVLNQLDIDALMAFLLTPPILNTENSDTLWSVLRVLRTALAHVAEHRTHYTPVHTTEALARALVRKKRVDWRVPVEVWSEVLNTVIFAFFLPMKSVAATDPRWTLAATLAAHLSWLKRDGYDAAWIWTPFLTAITAMLSCTTVVDFLHHIPNTRHLAQHCRELKDDWCADLKRLKIQSNDPPNYLTQCIHQVLSYHPCTTCPNPAAAW